MVIMFIGDAREQLELAVEARKRAEVESAQWKVKFHL